jgi:N-acetylglucosamine-6-phosphate deacetylase
VTLAPELNGAVEFIGAIASEVVVSAGHTNCSYPCLRNAISAGLTFVTHIGNGCRQTIDRHDNPIVNFLGCPELTLSFIPDGFHLPEAFLGMLLNSRPVDKLVVVSDCVKFAGMRPAKYQRRNGVEISLSENGKLFLTEDPTILAGSSSNMMKCVNHVASLGVLGEQELMQIGFKNQLRVLGLDPSQFDFDNERLHYDRTSRRFVNSPS